MDTVTRNKFEDIIIAMCGDVENGLTKLVEKESEAKISPDKTEMMLVKVKGELMNTIASYALKAEAKVEKRDIEVADVQDWKMLLEEKTGESINIIDGSFGKLRSQKETIQEKYKQADLEEAFRVNLRSLKTMVKDCGKLKEPKIMIDDISAFSEDNAKKVTRMKKEYETYLSKNRNLVELTNLEKELVRQLDLLDTDRRTGDMDDDFLEGEARELNAKLNDVRRDLGPLIKLSKVGNVSIAGTGQKRGKPAETPSVANKSVRFDGSQPSTSMCRSTRRRCAKNDS